MSCGELMYQQVAAESKWRWTQVPRRSLNGYRAALTLDRCQTSLSVTWPDSWDLRARSSWFRLIDVGTRTGHRSWTVAVWPVALISKDLKWPDTASRPDGFWAGVILDLGNSRRWRWGLRGWWRWRWWWWWWWWWWCLGKLFSGNAEIINRKQDSAKTLQVSDCKRMHIRTRTHARTHARTHTHTHDESMSHTHMSFFLSNSWFPLKSSERKHEKVTQTKYKDTQRPPKRAHTHTHTHTNTHTHTAS